MEPRPHERGKSVSRKRPSASISSFNGATSSRTWKVQTPSRLAFGVGSFNGATSSRTWKAKQNPAMAAVIAKLQWSHVLTNVESPSFIVDFCSRTSASMEPRPHERGKNRCAACRIRNRERFNGATSSRTWKAPASSPARTGGTMASMEPRPHERGKLAVSLSALVM